MHPVIIEAVGAERSRELQQQAAAWRQAQDFRHPARPPVRIWRTRRSLRVPATA